jgi:DHA2 family multidrug resistance protein-like MFS transporter
MNPTASPKARRSDWVGLAVLALPCMVVAMDMTVLNLALPALSTELKPGASQLLWIVDAYGFMVAGFLIAMGTLGDRIGRKKLLLAGGVLFTAASIAAALASTAAQLVAARALLGVAGATIAPSTMSLIRNMFHDGRQRQLAIGIWMASFSMGGAIGPLVGGALLQWFHWSAVFWAAVPVMLMLLVLGPKLLPEYKDPNAGRIDLASVALVLPAVWALIYGLKKIAEEGPAPAWLACAALGGALGWLFVRRQARLPYPLLDTTLFRQPRFTAAISAYGLSALAMLGCYIFITQYLQLVLGLSPLHAGLATLPWAVAFVVGSLLTPRLAARFAAVDVLVWGLAVAALGYALLLPVDESRTGLALVVASALFMSLGLAPVFTLGNEMIITAAPPERAGAASALSETAAEFSGALGIAVIGSLGMLWYRWQLAPQLPATLAATERAEALATIGGAIAVGTGAPGAEALQPAAKAAFIQALQFSAGVGLVITLLACWLCARLLRRPPPAVETPALGSS